MNNAPNRRILLVDDTPAIHDDFRKVLAPATPTSDLQDDEAILFGTAPKAVALAFEVSSALQGAEALAMVKSARRDGKPYAMAFVDVRMPPGWDGVETVRHLWEEDPALQVVLCTAYSDYSWPEVLARLDVRDRLLILKKPFDPIEVYQFASALTTKWQLNEQAQFKMSELEDAVEKRTRELANANIIVQSSPVILYRLRGEPAFPLIYVSHNITKLGHSPEDLLADADWARRLIHPDDRPKVGEAMARIFDKHAPGASIEFRLLTADGGIRWVENRYVPVRDKAGLLTEIEGIVIDITERKAAEDRIAHLARTDTLTGLFNRASFTERLRQAFAAAKRGSIPFAILYLDLDRFKPVNDTLGHAAGDLLLQQVAQRLKACARETDVVARLGGDEFAVLQTEVRDATNAGELANKIQQALARPYHLNDNEVNISVSIGISSFTAEIPDSDAMLIHADLALYRSKEEGRNQYRFHTAELDQKVLERVTLASELRGAIDRGELSVDYQPQFALSTGCIVGMEALVRWNHPSRGVLAPAAFIPIAEQTGAIFPLGRWVLENACRQMRDWRDQDIAPPVIAINLSLAQLKRGDELIAEVGEALAKYDLQAADLEFDMTEGTLAQLKWSQNEVLAGLHALGVKIAIDEFGGAYSSFDYIRSYRVNHLKISRTHINRSDRDADAAAFVKAIISFANETGIGVIAQGVETAAQQDALLLSGGTALAQGFHFSPPVNEQEATRLLVQQRSRPAGTPGELLVREAQASERMSGSG